MFLKVIVLILLLLNISFASYETVRIGKIDSHYKNKISKGELRKIIDEIEQRLESQLQINIFDYNQKSGKDIDIVYVAPTKLEKRINRNIKRLEKKQKEIDKLQKQLPEKQEEIDILKNEIEYETKSVNQNVQEFNSYVNEINRGGPYTKEEYKKIQEDVKQRKKILDKEIKFFNKKQREVQKTINIYNRNINSYNNLINQYNSISAQLEVMSRGFKKVKGMTFGMKEIKVKTFHKNGKRFQEKTVRNNMDKIEIYGFDSIKELKAILAHEIGHLVGIPHINPRNALMNPILQKNQIKNLYLTKDDIEAFKENF